MNFDLLNILDPIKELFNEGGFWAVVFIFGSMIYFAIPDKTKAKPKATTTQNDTYWLKNEVDDLDYEVSKIKRETVDLRSKTNSISIKTNELREDIYSLNGRVYDLEDKIDN